MKKQPTWNSGGKNDDKGTDYCEFMCLILNFAKTFKNFQKHHPPGVILENVGSPLTEKYRSLRLQI